MEEDYNADELANQLMVSLLTGENLDITFDPIPTYPFDFGATNPIFSALTKLTVGELTEGTVAGNGVFDVMMRAFKAHLEQEFTKNRITGAEYTKAYIALTTAALSGSVQFLLGRDQAFWAAANAQVAAANALTELAIAKMKYQIAQVELKTGRATFALTKLKLAGEDLAVGTAKYNLNNLLPAQLAQLEAQTLSVTTLLPEQLTGLQKQNALLVLQQAQMAEQTELVVIQQALTTEQIEVQRAQTLDTRTDGVTAIVGQVGKQKDLYDQQITSYKRASELGVAKLYSDAWITQKTLDEGLLAPAQFVNAEIDEVLSALKTNIGMGTVP